MTISINVGTAVNDKKVTVSDSLTVAEVLANSDVQVNGQVYHNQSVIPPASMNKTLAELGFANDDTLYIVKKMDSAT